MVHGKEGPDRGISRCQFLEPVSSPPLTLFKYLEKLILGKYTQSSLVGPTEIYQERSTPCIKAIVIPALQIQALKTFWEDFQPFPLIPSLHMAVGFPLCPVTWLLLLETASVSCSAPLV